MRVETALRWVRDGLIMLAIAIAILAALEIGLRLYMGPPGFELEEERIATLTPNTTKGYLRSVDGGPRLIRWHTNAEGFRGPALKESPAYRVIVYGDSNVQSRFSWQGETFTGQLQSLLAESTGTDVEVLNAGVVGSGPDQSLLRMKAELERYEPDAVVFHLFTENDFGDIVRNRLFQLDGDGNLVRSDHPVVQDERMPTGMWSGWTHDFPKRLMITVFADGFARAKAREREPAPTLEHDPARFRESRLKQHAREFSVYAKDEPRRYSMFSDHYEADIAFEPQSESAVTKRALLSGVLREAHRVALEHGIPFLVVIQPNSRDLTTNLPNHHQVLEHTPGYDRRRLDRWMQGVCDDAGIDVLNLFDVFEDTGDPNDLYFPSPDPHWNEAGQRVAAEAVAARVAPFLR